MMFNRWRGLAVLGLVLGLLPGLGAGVPEARAEMFVVDSIDNAVKVYDANTPNTFLGNFVDNTDIEAARQLVLPRAAAFGDDGHMFVSGFNSGAVLRYTVIGGNLGKFAGVGSTTLDEPRGVAFRSGRLYVVDSSNDVKRYDPSKAPAQAFVDVFADTALTNAEGVAFGPDGNLYVSDRGTGAIARFNGTTGAFIGTLGAVELTSPEDMAFGADGRLYVADTGLSGKIARFDISTGQFQSFFVNNDAALATPRCLAFGPRGDLFVGDVGNATIRRYSSAGASLGVFVGGSVGGLVTPVDIIFAPPGGGMKLLLSFHWWGLLALTAVVGFLQLRHRRAVARLSAH